MDGSTPSADERFAEWYVWAKREIGNDNRVCLGAAQAAVEALEAGGDEQAARLASRRSVAGHGIGLISRIGPRRRAYAEWYDWARREVGGDRQRLHTAARVAVELLDQGADPAAAAQAAQAAVGPAAPPPVSTAPATPSTTVQPPPAADPAPVPPPAPVEPPLPVTTPAPGWQPPASVEPAPPQDEVPSPGGIPPPPPWPPGAGPAQAYSLGPWPHAAMIPAGYAVPVAAAAPSHVYGGFWRRLGAWVIDSVLLLIGLVIVGFVLLFFAAIGILSSGQDLENPALNLGISLAVYAIAFVLAWLYFAGLESSGWQATIGKRLMGLVVTDLGGRRIGFGRATGRYFSKVTIIGLLFVLFSARRQALQDMMANTLVVRREHLSLITSPPTEAQTRARPGAAGEVQGA